MWGDLFLRWLGRPGTVLAALGLILTSAPAWAAQGSIDHVQPDMNKVDVLFSMPDVATGDPDLDSLAVTLDGQLLEATATLASAGESTVRRTTVLAIDVSDSMSNGDRIEQARLAAKAFLDSAPADLYVGIVTFAGNVELAQPPTLDRAESEAIIENLALSRGTRLYDGVREALAAAGSQGQRNILVLSDGRDTSTTPLGDVVSEVSSSEVRADVIALGLSESDDRLLEQIANAVGGAS